MKVFIVTEKSSYGTESKIREVYADKKKADLRVNSLRAKALDLRASITIDLIEQDVID